MSGSPRIVAYVTTIFLIGLPLYYVIRAFQKSRGIDVDLAYKEIPPE
jgi:hypothetical protein